MTDNNIQVFVHTRLNDRNKNFLKEELPDGIKAVFVDELSSAVVREEFAASRYVFGNPPASWLGDKEICLQWMQLYSTGFNEYQGLERPIPVSNLHGFFARPCAETVLAGILALYRKIDELTLLKSRREWIGSALRPQLRLLYGKRVILLGMGTIARAVRELLSGFQCQVAFYARTNPDAQLRDQRQMLAALPETDILINTLPGTAETKQFVSARLLEALPSDAVFVNIGRGSTVDEPALIRVLQEERIAGAVLDVTGEEPLPVGNPLWNLRNVILTQHTGGGWNEEERGKVVFFLENLNRVRRGEQPLNLVDLSRGY